MSIRIFAVCFVAASVAAQPNPGSISTNSLPLSPATVIDAAGNVYATYGTNSAAGVTPGAAQTQPGGGLCPFVSPRAPLGPCTDVFIVKSDASGKKVYATLLGGPTNEYGAALTVDVAGNVYVIGPTGGSFPTTPNAAIPASTTSKMFAAKLNVDGSAFIYSTYLPDIIVTLSAIAVDAQGNAYVVGQTATNHACVVKLNADGSSVVYARVLAGANQESATAVVADAAGNAFVTGSTNSPDFPVSAGVVQSKLAGAQNAYLTKLDPSGNIVLSTFLGGSGMDKGSAVLLDADGNIYIAGADGSMDFPTTAGSFQPAPLVPAYSSTPGGFIAKLAPDFSSLVFSSYLWALGNPIMTLGPSGGVYLGVFAGPGFPMTKSAPMQCVPGIYDDSGGVVVAHLDPNGKLLDSTYVNEGFAYGLTVASDGAVLLTGERLSRIRFGDPGWIASPCMTLTIFNSATLGQGEVVPGEFITLFGFGIGPENGVGAQRGAEGIPTKLGGVRVLFDGTPAPVLYAQSGQVNAQAPFELSGQSKTSVTLEYGGTTFGPVNVSVRFGDPGLFRLQPDVSAQAYALNEDRTINGPSNPAIRGSVVTLWGNGFGSTSPGCATGGLNATDRVNLAPELSVVIWGGGAVKYSGGAPGLACGVVQIDVQVPLDAAPGARMLQPELVMTRPNGVMTFADSSVSGTIIYVK